MTKSNRAAWCKARGTDLEPGTCGTSLEHGMCGIGGTCGTGFQPVSAPLTKRCHTTRRHVGKGLLTRAAILLFAGSSLFQGCPAGGLLSGILSDCFGDDTISNSEYDDLNVLEQLLYEENDCGRYEERSL